MYLWLIHVDVWQKLTQYCEIIILQLKINLNKIGAVLDREFYIIITSLKHIFISQNGNHYRQHIFTNEK